MFDASWNPVIVYVLATILGIWLKEVLSKRMAGINMATIIFAEIEYDKIDTMPRLQKILRVRPEEFKTTLAKDPLSTFLSSFDSYKSQLSILPPDVVGSLFKLQKFKNTVFKNFFSFYLEELSMYENYGHDLSEEDYEEYFEYLNYLRDAVQQKIFLIEDLMGQLMERLYEFKTPFYKKIWATK